MSTTQQGANAGRRTRGTGHGRLAAGIAIVALGVPLVGASAALAGTDGPPTLAKRFEAARSGLVTRVFTHRDRPAPTGAPADQVARPAGPERFGGGASAQTGTVISTLKQAARTAPCDATDCTVVARTDIDGDGRTDLASLTPTRVRGADAQVLRVVTARQAVAELRVRTPGVEAATAWAGATQLDARPGRELVLRTNTGSTPRLAVYTWRDGALRAVRSPATHATTWTPDTVTAHTR